MPTPRAPWTTAMLDHLDDGRWYEIDQVLAVGMRAVPPGRAIQERERGRTRRNQGTGPRSGVTDTDRIATGARMLARGALIKLVRNGHAQRDGQLVRRKTNQGDHP